MFWPCYQEQSQQVKTSYVISHNYSVSGKPSRRPTTKRTIVMVKVRGGKEENMDRQTRERRGGKGKEAEVENKG